MSMARTIRILSRVSGSPGTRSGMARLRCEAAYAILVDQPLTNVVTGTSGNPPLANRSPSPARSAWTNAIDLAKAAGLAPATVDHGFRNAYLQSWNFNLQRELSPGSH